MTTSPLGSTSSNSTNSSISSAATGLSALNPSDFIKMMVTQLEHQDPLQPASNQDLLNQMSQISQLQSSTTLQSTLTNLASQNQLGAAASLIGKNVSGLDSKSNPISGNVSSVKVSGSDVNLILDNGGTLALSAVTNIAPSAPTATTGATAPTTKS